MNVDMNRTYESFHGEANSPPSEAMIRNELKTTGYEEKHINEAMARLQVQEIWE